MSQLMLDINECIATAAEHLGNANGNIFHSLPGETGQNDGQIYVRLKKKRFVVLDYRLVPTDADLHYASTVPYVECPSGAGCTKCISKDCNKVGIPVKLYDTNPEESISLYLRSGLCFECQRDLNEKRRVDRKRRPTDTVPLLYHIANPHQKKFKFHGSNEVVELSRDAIIVNGSLKNVKQAADGHSTTELANDMQYHLREANYESDRLFASAPNPATAGPVDPLTDVQGMYEKTFAHLNKSIFLLTQWKAAFDVASVAAATGDNGHSMPMVSLLLAADKDQQQHGVKASDDMGDMPHPPMESHHPPMESHHPHHGVAHDPIVASDHHDHHHVVDNFMEV
jgi:hypothetical protein